MKNAFLLAMIVHYEVAYILLTHVMTHILLDRIACKQCIDAACLSVGHNREPCKTTQPIELPFGVWTRVAQRNRMLSLNTKWGVWLSSEEGLISEEHLPVHYKV